jgi:hypothetical protein
MGGADSNSEAIPSKTLHHSNQFLHVFDAFSITLNIDLNRLINYSHHFLHIAD